MSTMSRDYQRRYYHTKRVRIRAMARERYRVNRNEILLRNKRKYWKNRNKELARSRAYRLRNREKLRAAWHEYAQVNKQQIDERRRARRHLKAEYDRSYYTRNKHRKQDQAKQWRLANLDYDLRKKREWYRLHREAVAAYHRLPERRIENRKRAKLQKLQRRAATTSRITNVTEQDLRHLMDSYLGLCVYCCKPANTFDHITPLSTGGDHCLSNLVPACRPCNASKSNRSLLIFLQGRKDK